MSISLAVEATGRKTTADIEIGIGEGMRIGTGMEVGAETETETETEIKVEVKTDIETGVVIEDRGTVVVIKGHDDLNVYSLSS
jgi:hypothetical protein